MGNFPHQPVDQFAGPLFTPPAEPAGYGWRPLPDPPPPALVAWGSNRTGETWALLWLDGRPYLGRRLSGQPPVIHAGLTPAGWVCANGCRALVPLPALELVHLALEAMPGFPADLMAAHMAHAGRAADPESVAAWEGAA